MGKEPVKAPTPAGTGEGAKSNGNLDNIVIHQSRNYVNTEGMKRPDLDPQFHEININSWLDLSPILERFLERALMYTVFMRPGMSIKAILDKKYEPAQDEEVKAFWEKIKPKAREIQEMRSPQSTEYLGKLASNSFFNHCLAAYNDIVEGYGPVLPEQIITHLLAVRVQRRSSNYIHEHRLMERILWKADL